MKLSQGTGARTMEKRKYDSTVARIAGNILGHLLAHQQGNRADNGKPFTFTHKPELADVTIAVSAARAIVAEVERTEPKAEAQP